MRLKLVASSVLLAASALTAQAADLPSKKSPVAAPVVASPWDFQIGGGLTSNYIFRGISQSNNRPSVTASGELRYNFNDTYQGYVGVSGESIKLTNIDVSPAMELDVYGGMRGTWGAFSADVGVWGYLYPGLGTTPSVGTTVWGGNWVTNPTWFELYGKLGYNITDAFSIGANLFYTPSYLDTHAPGTYISGTAKYTIGDFAISGELGRQFLGTTDVRHTPFTGVRNLPDYTYYNIGASYTYKFATLDLRVHGSSLGKRDCAAITGPTNNGPAIQANVRSSYCGTAVVGTISFALQGKDIK